MRIGGELMFLSKRNDNERVRLLQIAATFSNENLYPVPQLPKMCTFVLKHYREKLCRTSQSFELSLRASYEEISKIGFNKIDCEKLGLSYIAQHERFHYDKLDLDLIDIGVDALAYASLTVKYARKFLNKSIRRCQDYSRKDEAMFESEKPTLIACQERMRNAEELATFVISTLGSSLTNSLVNDSMRHGLFKPLRPYIDQVQENEKENEKDVAVRSKEK